MDAATMKKERTEKVEAGRMRGARKARRAAGAKGTSRRERTELVVGYRLKARKLARSILRRWHARLDVGEVDSIVDLSLCEAVQRFSPEKGASFMTFMFSTCGAT